MKPVPPAGLGLFLLLFCAGWNGCDRQPQAPSVPIYDVLAKEQALPVSLRPDLAVSNLTDRDLKQICSALGQTPGVKYEVKAITVFPTNGLPMAAQVQVPGYLVFMCRGRDDQWHVFRTAQFRLD